MADDDEEFDDVEVEEEEEQDEEEEEPEEKPKKKVDKKFMKAIKKEVAKEVERDEDEEKPTEKPKAVEPQVVAVPRAVSIETMFNELYDGQQEIKQLLMAWMQAVQARGK